MPQSLIQGPDADVLAWLMAGDAAVQYQAKRDLTGHDDKALQNKIAGQGWGARFLAARHADGSWGRGFYQPKWISSHYTLLDLRLIGLPQTNALARASVEKILREQHAADNGLGPARTIAVSDVCVHGMALNYASYFGAPESALQRVVDFILAEAMPDGGFNCQRNTVGATHSSMHSTLSVLEGIQSYCDAGYHYRTAELERAAMAGREFLLIHQLFKSHRTGAIIQKDFLRLVFPPRWKYNVLRALDYFRSARCPWDPRMQDALDVVIARRGRDGRWPALTGHAGQVHFQMEEPRQPGRWNTLIGLRILNDIAPRRGL